jgi:hypothetical protein
MKLFSLLRDCKTQRFAAINFNYSIWPCLVANMLLLKEVQDQDSCWPSLSVGDDFEWAELVALVLGIWEVPSSYLGNDRPF